MSHTKFRMLCFLIDQMFYLAYYHVFEITLELLACITNLVVNNMLP
ncbi:hypothetical protein NC652_033574 [Populus alba x Populus x berolinensis]|uniref:Uncharacterized protein n=1 Tax=Populus alba x Populus x berolinensis TaxID=444605 RepID=A0AAD6LWS4_9ROSI|nr:hypothetical protein NC652_033574 [Populus alba x Populus x berolinensis]KAJ6973202.1 hypothetical protein NC653_033515 [Populus alba x Populus x berolinensis]